MPEARTIRWRPHTEKPATAASMSALLAARDDAEGEFYLIGLKLWQRGVWVDENDGRPLRDEAFWWAPEEEICRELKRMLRLRAFKTRRARARRG